MQNQINEILARLKPVGDLSLTAVGPGFHPKASCMLSADTVNIFKTCSLKSISHLKSAAWDFSSSMQVISVT